MADIAIPGSKNSYNTQEVRRGMLTLEYKRLEKLEGEDKKLTLQKDAWTLIKDKLSFLNDKATALTRFDSPLRQMFGNSSNPAILTATAESSATRGEYEVVVEQKADVDKFSSTHIAKDYKPPVGEYIFMVGEKEIKFNFNGGSISDWIKTVNTRGASFLKAETIRSGVQGEVLILSSLKEGEKNPLLFKGMAEQLANDLGILSKAKVHFEANLEEVSTAQNSPYNKLSYSVMEEDGESALILQPSSEVAINLPTDFELTDKSVLKVKIAVREASDFNQETNTIRSPEESVTYQGITIENEFSELSFLAESQALANARRLPALSAYADGQTTALEQIVDLPEIREMTIALGDLKKTQEILIENGTSDKIYIVESVEVTDPRNRDGYLPEKALSFAQDAKLEIDGIEVTRPSNKISDLVPKVNLNLESASEEKVNLVIEPDYKRIEDSIVDFISSYNDFLAFATILGTRDPAVKAGDPNAKTPIIDEIGWLSEDEKKQAYELLGLLQTDFVLSNLKTSLQTFISGAYDTNDERYRLLSQVGIAPSSQAGQGMLRRQYMAMDTSKFQNSLKENWEAVQQIFSQTPLGSSQPNNGVAFKISNFAQPYVRFNGLLDTRIKQINTDIEKKTQDIGNYKEKIDEKDRKLQNDLRKLEANVTQSESMTRNMNNYFNPKGNE